jgi:hypothetical protein
VNANSVVVEEISASVVLKYIWVLIGYILPELHVPTLLRHRSSERLCLIGRCMVVVWFADVAPIRQDENQLKLIPCAGSSVTNRN